MSFETVERQLRLMGGLPEPVALELLRPSMLEVDTAAYVTEMADLRSPATSTA